MSLGLSPVTGPEGPAYAMFISPTFCEYAYRLPILLGRSNITKSENFININTGVKDRRISRRQATVTYFENQKQYVIRNEARMIIIVDGKTIHQGDICALKSGSAIKISNSQFYFILPKKEIEDDKNLKERIQETIKSPNSPIVNKLPIKRVIENDLKEDKRNENKKEQNSDVM